jgi:hypothetical protein
MNPERWQVVENIETPWGLSDRAKVAELPGGRVLYVTTPSHGGFALRGSALDAAAALWPDFRPWADRLERTLREIAHAGGGPDATHRVAWLEEDCDAALALVAFPELFGAEQVTATRRAAATGMDSYFRRRGCWSGVAS